MLRLCQDLVIKKKEMKWAKEWIEYTGEGMITGSTIIAVAPTFMAEVAPYKMAIVKLDEGPSITGIIEAENEAKIGDRVTTKYASIGEKKVLQFKPQTK